jgi:Fe-S-cluster containining protein
MKLNVIPAQDQDGKPWYAQGLEFTCTQCGNCCTGGPGFVWISDEEVQRLAIFLKITPEQAADKYCRDIANLRSLKEVKNAAGNYDCIFLTETPAAPRADGKVSLPKRGCAIYPVRPLQCRTWPFWPENLRDRKTWDKVAKRCHGMNNGRVFSLKQIETIRDADDWPARPPTSAGVK